jgi:hypothetical protein
LQDHRRAYHAGISMPLSPGVDNKASHKSHS